MVYLVEYLVCTKSNKGEGLRGIDKSRLASRTSTWPPSVRLTDNPGKFNSQSLLIDIYRTHHWLIAEKFSHALGLCWTGMLVSGMVRTTTYGAKPNQIYR